MRNMLPIGTRYCQCEACKRYFKSPGAFDKHRYGPYSDRSCIDPIELGMVLNDKGYWMTPWPESGSRFIRSPKAKLGAI